MKKELKKAITIMHEKMINCNEKEYKNLLDVYDTLTKIYKFFYN
jgi:hypothetical protein